LYFTELLKFIYLVTLQKKQEKKNP
jgi:hypothetical protein